MLPWKSLKVESFLWTFLSVLTELIYNKIPYNSIQKEEAATHRVIVTVFTDEGHSGIARNIAATFTHQITKGL